MNTLDTQSDILADETPEPAMPTLENTTVAELEAPPQQDQTTLQNSQYPQGLTSSTMPKAFDGRADSALTKLNGSSSLDALNGSNSVHDVQLLCHMMVTGNPFPPAADDEMRAYFGPQGLTR